jgi:hypothetical protein
LAGGEQVLLFLDVLIDLVIAGRFQTFAHPALIRLAAEATSRYRDHVSFLHAHGE